jgi:ribosomal-protein-alanine N-acetyltransferase
MIGNVGFHGQPGVNAAGNERGVEIGYGVQPEHRRQGYATEAVEGLIGWARTQGVDHFVASVSRDNEPSLASIRKLGLRAHRAAHRSRGRPRARVRAAD